jgi:hypothetical protein
VGQPLPVYPDQRTSGTDPVGPVRADFVAEVGDDESGAAASTRLLMRWSAICCTGSG